MKCFVKLGKFDKERPINCKNKFCDNETNCTCVLWFNGLKQCR